MKIIKRKFVKLKNGTKIPMEKLTTPEMKEIVTRLAEAVAANRINIDDAGIDIYRKLNLPVPVRGTHWMFKSAARFNQIAPWCNIKFRGKKDIQGFPTGEDYAGALPSISTPTIPTDLLSRIKNLESEVHFWKEKSEKIKEMQATMISMGESIELLMDAYGNLERAENVHLSPDGNGNLVLTVPSKYFFKQAAIIENEKIDDIIKGKKIVIIGPETTQRQAFSERLPGAVIDFFTGKELSEQPQLIQKCSTADVILVWIRFCGHWATEATYEYKKKRILMPNAGVTLSVDKIIQRLKKHGA